MTTTTTAPAGKVADWDEAKALRVKLNGIRAEEAQVSDDLDRVVHRLAKANSGYVIARELGMERPTVSRILKRKPKRKRAVKV
jgi:hypothetical protein